MSLNFILNLLLLIFLAHSVSHVYINSVLKNKRVRVLTPHCPSWLRSRRPWPRVRVQVPSPAWSWPGSGRRPRPDPDLEALPEAVAGRRRAASWTGGAPCRRDPLVHVRASHVVDAKMASPSRNPPPFFFPPLFFVIASFFFASPLP